MGGQGLGQRMEGSRERESAGVYVCRTMVTKLVTVNGARRWMDRLTFKRIEEGNEQDWDKHYKEINQWHANNIEEDDEKDDKDEEEDSNKNHYTKFYLKELNKFNREIFIVIKLINFISLIMDNEITRERRNAKEWLTHWMTIAEGNCTSLLLQQQQQKG